MASHLFATPSRRCSGSWPTSSSPIRQWAETQLPGSHSRSMRRDARATRRADNVRETGREVFLEFGYPRWMVPVIGVMQGAVAVANFHDNGVQLLGGAAGALCCTSCSCAAPPPALSATDSHMSGCVWQVCGSSWGKNCLPSSWAAAYFRTCARWLRVNAYNTK